MLFIKKYWLLFVLLLVGATYIIINLINTFIQLFGKTLDIQTSPLHISNSIKQKKYFGFLYKLLNLLPMLTLCIAFIIITIIQQTRTKIDKNKKYITLANILPGITAIIPEPLIPENFSLIFMAVIIYIIVIW